MRPRPLAVPCAALLALLVATGAQAQAESRRRAPAVRDEGSRRWVEGAHERPNMVVGMDATGFGLEGGAVGAHARLEGWQWGVDARVTALALNDTDALVMDSLLEVHLTYTLVAQPRARLRLTGGLDSAHVVEEVSVYGPGMGLSLEACVAGPLDLELRGHVTPFPFRQVEGAAGLALQLGALGVRGGLRGLYFEDDGLVDGFHRRASLVGPYLGLALTF